MKKIQSSEKVEEYYLHELNLREETFREEKKIAIEKDQVSVEDIAKNYYKKEFEVYNVEPGDEIISLPIRVKEKLCEHPSVYSEIPPGFPDLIIYDKEREQVGLVEVKSGKDAVRFNQFKFIEKCNKPVIIAFIKKNSYQRPVELACSDCGAVFENENSLDEHNCGIDSSVMEVMEWNGYGFTS